MRATPNGQARADQFMRGPEGRGIGLCVDCCPVCWLRQLMLKNTATPAPQSEVAPQPATTPEVTTAPAVPPAVPAETAQPDQKAVGSLPHNLSPWGMFMAADWVVKAVMIGLAFASLVTWTVWLAKTLELAGARVRAYRALNAIGNARTLRDAERALEGRGGPGASLVNAAREEVRFSDRGAGTCQRGWSERARRIAIGTHRGTSGPPHEPRHRRPCNHRLHGTLRRSVWHGLGHHEFLYRHFGSHRRQILRSLRQVLPKLCWQRRSVLLPLSRQL